MILVVMASLAAAGCRATAITTATATATEPNETPEQLVETLRRQLMHNNYDYLPESAGEAGQAGEGAPSDGDDERRLPVSAAMGPGALGGHVAGAAGGGAGSDEGLLYYANGGGRRRLQPAGGDPGDDEGNNPKVKYKVLKVRAARAGRRSLAPRRFVQEEGEDGVAIISLDGGPFPEFRLPSGRRQYMLDREPLPGPAAAGGARLVDIIKRELRNNNDDYAELIPQDATEPHSGTGGGAGGGPYRRSDRYDKTRRAPHGASRNSEEKANATVRWEVMGSLATESEHPSPQAPPPAPRTTAPALEYKSFTSDKFPKYVNKSKMGKLKKFLDRHRGLLDDFISNKHMQTETQTVSMRAGGSAEGAGSRAAPGSRRDPPPPLVLPNSEQLDMAPAKGGRINIMRVQGQLCERNVMVPEGPKYDSKGVSYLPAYKGARARVRDYPRTRAPSLVLPRCCNCCKKSVLGCE